MRKAARVGAVRPDLAGAARCVRLGRGHNRRTPKTARARTKGSACGAISFRARAAGERAGRGRRVAVRDQIRRRARACDPCGGAVRIFGRSGLESTANYPEVVLALRQAAVRALRARRRDIAFGPDGRPSFQALQRRIQAHDRARIAGDGAGPSGAVLRFRPVGPRSVRCPAASLSRRARNCCAG